MYVSSNAYGLYWMLRLGRLYLYFPRPDAWARWKQGVRPHVGWDA